MDLGTGIFLSSILISLVALYSITKDRWNWVKISRYLFALILVCLSLILAINIGNYIYEKIQRSDYQSFENTPIKPTELLGVTLGEKKSDVIFKHGKPIKDNKSILNYEDFQVFIEDDKVTAIVYNGPAINAPKIDGLSIYDNLEAIELKLGSPTKITESKDHTARSYSFDSHNVGFIMEKNEIKAIYIYDGNKGKGLHFEK